MIRLPPTSISLAENDLAFHLQQIDIYHGLLKQGFKKKEIIRYFKEHNEAQQPQSASAIDIGPPSLTGVGLAARGCRILEPPAQQPPTPAQKRPETSESSTVLTARISDSGQAREQQTAETPTSSSPDFPASLLGHRHAPRQSSLLRFAETVSSSSSGQTEHASNHAALPARTYRPRTDTYSYDQSEISESELINEMSELRMGSSTFLEASGEKHNSSTPSWAEAESFVPGRSQLWASRPSIRCVSPETAAPGDNSSARLGGQQGELIETITPRLVSIDETLRMTSIGPVERTESRLPSSPPNMGETVTTQPHRYHMSSSPSLPPMPAIQTPSRRAEREARTEPRRPQHQHPDGTSFPVYNDGLPAHAQPQTPADLSRHLLLTEQAAAYTAPPGALQIGSPVGRSRRPVPDADIERGEQSPMAHAMGSRERRARELMRGVRAEGVRLRRLREQDREVVATGFDGNNEDTEMHGAGPAIATDHWRDELEGDRVGDENWEDGGDWTPRRRDGMRVTSGNARNRWWE